MYQPSIDASVVRAVQPGAFLAREIVALEFVAEADVAAVAGNKARYLKGDTLLILLSIIVLSVSFECF